MQFRSENFGESELAERFGVRRYPAVFIDEVLVARPKDFGFFGESGAQGAGRYVPWLQQENRDKFRVDMEHLLAKAVRGELSGSDGVEAGAGAGLTRMPEFSSTDLEGVEVGTDSLLGGVTLIDFWATWCPPCIQALPWLVDLQNEYADELRIVGVVIESPDAEVRKIVDRFELPFSTVVGTPELAADFGDLVAVPTAFLFDRKGRLVRTFYGAPPELKKELVDLVGALTSGGTR